MNYSNEELRGYESELVLIVNKLNALRLSLHLQNDPSVIFKIEMDISTTESRKSAVEKILNESYNIGSNSGKSRLKDKIRTLQITKEVKTVDMLNVNRKALRNRFADGFLKRQTMETSNHFYFLSACQTQLPPSFGERMIYEMIGNYLDEEKDAVFFIRKEDKFNRVIIDELPFGSSQMESEMLFKSFCTRRFKWKDNKDFESALSENRLPHAQYKYVVMPFYIQQEDWQDFFPNYFDWIAHNLEQRPKNGPIILFFVVFYHDNLHKGVSEESAHILKTVDLICEKYPNAGHFYPLEPVTLKDVNDWFTKLGESNPDHIEEVINTLGQGLQGEKLRQFLQDKKLNMATVEPLQKLVFEMYVDDEIGL
jgi:hypothetical protein